MPHHCTLSLALQRQKRKHGCEYQPQSRQQQQDLRLDTNGRDSSRDPSTHDSSALLRRYGQQWTELDSRSWVTLSGGPFAIMYDARLRRQCARWQYRSKKHDRRRCFLTSGGRRGRCGEFRGSARRISIPVIFSRYQSWTPHCKPTATASNSLEWIAVAVRKADGRACG